DPLSLLLCHVYSTFFSYTATVNPDPFSLPTLRSSDLPSGRDSLDARRRPGHHDRNDRRHHRRRRDRRHRRDPAADRRRPPGGHRSEEHTSELKSRFELVCRIFLGKKKYYNIIY